jgi:peptidoglycan/xylan/chitin deacetylase (PgdA/CDA1 family)
MTLKHSVLQVCGNLIPDLYRPPAGILFPYGHIVADVSPPHIKHLFAITSIAKFRSTLDFFCRHWRPLQIAELAKLPLLHQKNLPAHSFLLSFDDGMREVYDIIAPILREKGIPAIFFLNSGTVDNRQLMWRHKVSLLIERSRQQPGRIPQCISLRPDETLTARLLALGFADMHIIDEVSRFFEVDLDDYLRRTKPYLTTGQVLELSRAGFEFGAHSDTHPYFNKIAVEDQKQQISASVAFVRGLGLQCRYFAFPFHDHGVPPSVFSHMKDLDLVLSFGTSEARLDSIAFSFQRFALDAENANSGIPEILRQLSAKSLARRLSRTELIKRN